MIRSLFLAMLLGASAAAAAPRPNIIVILSDDMGYSDLGCYGSEIATPNLDRLASNGLRFTRFYNNARCCPTRASLLTGLYPHQAGIGHMVEDKKQPGYRGDLNANCPTIAEALKPAGYRTYATGKWHVTPGSGREGLTRTHNWPLQRGFDRYYGTIHGAGSYWDPSALVRDNKMLTAFTDPEYKPETFYYTDAISEQASRFIGEHARDHAHEPFFLYVAFTAAHWPLHAKESDIAKYKGKYDAGYEAIRQARFAKQKQLGVVPAGLELPPGLHDWARTPNKEWEARCMEVYAAQVDGLDQGIGRIVKQLEDSKMLDNTLILFLQDNGGCAETTGRKGDVARQPQPTLPPMAPTDLQFGSQPKQTRDGRPVLGGPAVMPGPADTYIAYGEAWAHVSNTPFREYKHWVHEGGISTPLIAHWPAGISDHNALRPQPGHVIDIMATCLDVAGAQFPAEQAGQKTVPPEGRSLVPAFANKPLDRDLIYWEHEGNRAVSNGKWKLVAKGPGNPWELYDLESDRTEQHDLAAAQTERVAAMTKAWEEWARRVLVLPWVWDPPYGQPKTPKAGGKEKTKTKKEADSPLEKSEEKITYKKVGEQALDLILVKPADWKAGDKRAAIVLFHGGGWVNGKADVLLPQARHFASRGMAAVTADYRMLAGQPKAPPTVCIEDAASVMRWVRGRADSLGIDPKRIAAGGGSAGGHLAAFLGTASGFDDPQDDLKVSRRPDALVLFNPVFDNGPGEWGNARVGDRFREFSPAHNISADDPPTLVLIGDQDKLVPVATVERFREAMRKAGPRCEVVFYPGQGHGFFNQEPFRTRTLEEADKFLASLGFLKES